MVKQGISKKEIKEFQKTVLNFFKKNGRRFPWRNLSNSIDPYHVLVSEMMLQQTQASRVIPKFEAFIKKFPTISALNAASAREVLLLWQGLGYNRRALMLKRAAGEIIHRFHGSIPGDVELLETLSGVGPYTARAIAAFAFNKPAVVIETNIRTVYIHHFFSKEIKVGDEKLFPAIAQTLLKENPRMWYSALMDYGAHLKSTIGNASKKSASYAKQAKFKGSFRELRGKILRTAGEKTLTTRTLFAMVGDDRAPRAFSALVNEGFLMREGDNVSLAIE